MNILTPSGFVSAFERVIRRPMHAQRLAQLWGPPWRAAEFTALFQNEKAGILRDLAAELKCHYASEWWSLDGIFYEPAERGQFKDDLRMSKYLYAAIEHENYSNRAAYQVSKLCVFNAQLKILITYPGSPNHRSNRERERLLRDTEDVIKDADSHGALSHSGKVLLTLGSDDPKEDAGRLQFRHYVYVDGLFTEFPPNA